VISEKEIFLIVATRVYDQALSNFAQAQGIDYQLVKKQRQRAEAKIRKYLKKTRRNFSDLSPSPFSAAPFTSEGKSEK